MPSTENYITQAAGDARYQQLGGLGSSSPNTIEPDDAPNAGVSPSGARQDHEHGIVADAPVNIGLAGTNSESSSTSFARSGHIHAYNPPACRVFNNANISVANAGAESALTFNSERYDTDSMHSTTVNTGRITFNTAGLYEVTLTLNYAGNTTGDRVAAIRLNGTTFVGYSAIRARAAANGTVVVATTTYKFAAADYVEAMAFQDSGGALNITAAGNYSPEFSATWVGVG